MKLAIQRVRSASVSVGGKEIASIGHGALILAGVQRGDTRADFHYLARKAAQLRIYDDADGKMNAAIEAVDGSFIVVSQFTLLADCRKGNRPSYTQAADPTEGEAGIKTFVSMLREHGRDVQTGRFGADMNVALENDGPVTILLESHGR